MSRPMKHSLTLGGHRTSVTLEDEFWQAFREIAQQQGKGSQQPANAAWAALLFPGHGQAHGRNMGGELRLLRTEQRLEQGRLANTGVTGYQRCFSLKDL